MAQLQRMSTEEINLHPRQGCGPVSAVPEAIASRPVLGCYSGQVGRLSRGHLPLVQIAGTGRAR